MTGEERESLRQRFQFRCGYCGVREQDVGAQLTVDHFQPRSKGGTHEQLNWVYCCHACNEFKGDLWMPDSSLRLLHPLNDDLTMHVRETENGTLESLSPTGAFQIDRLKLNRLQLVAHRRARARERLEKSAATFQLDRIQELENHIVALEMLVRELGDGE